MPLVISILCCAQIIGGFSLMVVALHSHKTFQYSVNYMNMVAQKLAIKLKDATDSEQKLSEKEIEKLNTYLKYLAETIKVQITLSFLSLYFIGSKIVSKPMIPMFSTFTFATVNVFCGLVLLSGGEMGWYLGISACVYALLRNVHALMLVPKITQNISRKTLNIRQFYTKYIIRSVVLIFLIIHFFSNEIRLYFSTNDSLLEALISIEIAAVGFIGLDYTCYKIEEFVNTAPPNT